MKRPALTPKAVFDQAHEITSPAERKAYLDQACAAAPELRQKVEALLRAYDEAGSFLEASADSLSATGPYQTAAPTPSQSRLGAAELQADLPQPHVRPREEEPGTWVGPYRLVKKLGEGGMGAVYLAEQEQPIRRRVALKIIKPGLDSAQVVARFQAERQALTLMDHAHIARVYEAGATELGRPYFVMELVQGSSLTRFCSQNTLPLRDRLTLFITVCQAIQHAHQKGIIHRDLKPSNVLVTRQDGRPNPKVIDFGLAKATEPTPGDRTLTQMGTILGTLQYMSPEQANFGVEGLDTRTDIYSLGVMLYELLTGGTPLDDARVRAASVLEVLRWIKEEEPPRPSVRVAASGERLAALAAERQVEPAGLPKLLRHELDWIVLKALEKDRNRRYESASDMARDLQRYLNDEPVEACPPSAGYRLGKFARKHRTLLATTTAFLVLLTLGVVGLVIGLIQVNAARQEAVAAEKGTRKALTMTWAMIRAQVRKGARPGDAEKVILRNTLQAYRQLLAEQGHSQEQRAMAAETEFRTANLAALLGSNADAEAGYRRAIALYEALAQEFPGEPEYANELARCHFDRAILLTELGQRPEAEAAYRRAIELHERVAAAFPAEPAYRSELADAYNNLGALLRDRQDLAAAEGAFRRAVTLGDQVAAALPEHPQYRINLAAGCHNLGNAIRDQGKTAGALPWYARAVELLTALDPRPDDANLFLRNAYWDRANALGQLGRHAEACRDWQQAIDRAEGLEQDHLRLFLAAAQLEEKMKAMSKPAGADLYQAARIHARATAAAAATAEAGLYRQHAGRSLALLQQAQAAGWFDTPQRIQQLANDDAFAALPADDFRRLLQNLANDKGTPDVPARN